MQLPLTLQLKPSRIFLVLIGGGHVLAGVAVLLLPLPWWLRAVGVMLLVLHLGFLLYRGGRGVRALHLQANGKLLVDMADGRSIESEVAAATVVLPWVAVVHTCEAIPPLVIFPDALQDPDSHRQLHVWLRWRVELEQRT